MRTAQRLLVLVFVCSCVVATLAMLLRVPAVLGQPAEGRPAASWRISLGDVRQLGEASLRWMGLKVYDARLYGPARDVSAGQLFEHPFALELSYALSLRGARIADRSIEEINQLGQGTDEERRRWHGQMLSLFPDVRAADRLTGTYHPRHGARFYLNDQPVGEIADIRFARAFFSIWLDERTSVPALRRDLLSGLSATTADSRQ
ncbi:MAG: hypothetical protein RLZZ153_1789 [Pseudomonadota bacterium]|jgi:hypothetical protein